jgi:uncharacterized protein YjbI with pentapeptide repeats
VIDIEIEGKDLGCDSTLSQESTIWSYFESFERSLLKGVDFNGVELLGTVFHNCDLCSADFSSSTQYDIDPRTNKITKAKFSFPEAAGLLRAFDITLV